MTNILILTTPRDCTRKEELTLFHDRCPYKGVASYFSVILNGKEFKDVVWWYKYPTAESARITGMICFYNEKVDTFIDGVLETK